METLAGNSTELYPPICYSVKSKAPSNEVVFVIDSTEKSLKEIQKFIDALKKTCRESLENVRLDIIQSNRKSINSVLESVQGFPINNLEYTENGKKLIGHLQEAKRISNDIALIITETITTNNIRKRLSKEGTTYTFSEYKRKLELA